MKTIAIFFSWMLLGCLSILLMATNAHESQNSLVGKWTEQKWEYETDSTKVPLTSLQTTQNPTMPMQVIRHQAEVWDFQPNGTLRIASALVQKEAKWSLKGRANVLVLAYPDGQQEHYQVTQIDDKSLVINFESQIQARGIAKLTFTRQ